MRARVMEGRRAGVYEEKFCGAVGRWGRTGGQSEGKDGRGRWRLHRLLGRMGPLMMKVVWDHISPVRSGRCAFALAGWRGLSKGRRLWH